MESKSVEEVAEATGLSEEQVKKKYPFSFSQVKPAEGTFKEGMSQAVDLGTDVAPIVGTAKAVAELPEDAELIKQLIAAGYEEGDIKKMGMGGAYTALTVAGLIPGVKVAADIAKKGIKEGVEGAVEETATQTARALSASSRQINNPEYDVIFSKLDELETPEEWQSAAKNLVSGERDITGMSPVRRTPELEQSARDLIDNKLLTREEHLKNVAENKPITEWTDLPRQPSSKAMVFSLKPSQRENGLFLLSDDDANKLGVNQTTLKDGDMFNGRLDIPAYQSYDTWVVAGTSPAVKTADGKGVTTYAKAIHYTSGDDKPVKFVASQKTSEGIGKGEKQKTGYATISGRYKDTSEEELRALAEEYLNDPEWSQVGFDPRRLGTFYLRRSTGDYKIGTPVTEADEVIQIGPLVLAKNAKLDPDYQGYNKGGAVPMKEQMEMFEDGGLKDEGGTIDPVSGNDVPPGSTQEEVRDDIPAQLSEGEFVFPADVVRYWGLDTLMRMRQQAKMGLRMMEEMGQMGNSEEATIPDDVPFDINDLDMDEEEEYNMAVGGMVPAQQQQTPATTGVVYQAPQFQPGQTQVGQAAAPIPMAQVARPQQQQVPVYQPPETLPSPAEFVKAPEGQAPQTIVIVNSETGEERTITFIPGVTQIPEGFVRKEDYVPKDVVPQTGTTGVESATVTQQDDNESPQTAAEVAEKRARVAAAKKMGITEQVGFSMSGVFGKYGPEDVGKFTPSGLIIGKDGVLLDPLTGMTREQSSPNMIAGILDAIAGGKEPPKPAYSDEFFDAMPDQAKDVLGRSLGKEARDARMTQQQRDIETFDKAVEETGIQRSDLRSRIIEERKEEVQRAKNNIAKVQAQARAEMASRDNRQQAAERAIREAGERQEDRNNDGRPDNETVQEAGDRYTAERVAEAIATGDYSRGFAEGGLASKPKPKAKKRMKRGGLASKKQSTHMLATLIPHPTVATVGPNLE